MEGKVDKLRQESFCGKEDKKGKNQNKPNPNIYYCHLSIKKPCIFKAKIKT